MNANQVEIRFLRFAALVIEIEDLWRSQNAVERRQLARFAEALLKRDPTWVERSAAILVRELGKARKDA